MIRDRGLLSEFNDKQMRIEKLDYIWCLRLFEGMWREGIALEVLPMEDPLEDIDVDIRIARILNHVR